MSHSTEKLTLNTIFYIICLYLVLFLVPLHKQTIMGYKGKTNRTYFVMPKGFYL